MATYDVFAPARPAPTRGFFSTLLGNFIDWNDRRVTAKALKALTDRELDDIGLTRADISKWSAL